MVEKLPAITTVLAPAPKKRGRKPGSPKVPGSGRKPGVGNKVPRNLHEFMLKRGKPLELLCDISRGVKVRVGPQAGPGEPQYTYPTMQERAAAAKILVDKLIPPAAALPQGEGETTAPPMDDLSLARLLTFILTKEARGATGQPVEPLPSSPASEREAVERARRIADEQAARDAAQAARAAREAADEADGVRWLGGRRIVPGWREDNPATATPRVITKRNR